MIIDLPKFIAEERPYWEELEKILARRERSPDGSMDLKMIKRFHYLYQKASADLAKIITFSSEPEIRGYLESLVSRAYGGIHETRERSRRPALRRRFVQGFPRTFRRYSAAFGLSLAITLTGSLFGGLAVVYDREAREVLIPFAPLLQHPSERVASEERTAQDQLEGGKASFASYLMTHNIRVSILVFALGATLGIGTVILLFYNGVILGAVAADYIMAGEMKFLLGWLLPHGAVEIPAILVAGQAGLVLAGAFIGGEERLPLGTRLRMISDDLVSLVYGLAVLLIWAGLIEAFLSQYHEPTIPYSFKIAFGCLEIVLLTLFLNRAGRRKGDKGSTEPG